MSPFKISARNFRICNTVLLTTVTDVHCIPTTYLFYNRKFAPFEPLPHLLVYLGDRWFQSQTWLRSLGWALSQSDWCPWEKRTFRHRLVLREDHVKTQGEYAIYKPRREALSTLSLDSSLWSLGPRHGSSSEWIRWVPLTPCRELQRTWQRQLCSLQHFPPSVACFT